MPCSCFGEVALARVNAVVVLFLDTIHSSADVTCGGTLTLASRAFS